MTAAAGQVAAWLDAVARRAAAADLPGALAIADEAVAQAPGAAALWNMRGAVLLGLGRADEGIGDLERAAGLDPRDAEPLRNLAAVHLSRQAWGRAQTAAGRLVALTPRDAEAHRLLAAAAAGMGRLPVALARLRVALGLGASHAQAWIDLAWLLNVDQPAEAIRAIERAQAVCPADPQLASAARDLVPLAAATLAQQAAPTDPDLARRRLFLAMQRLERRKEQGWSPGRSEGLELQAAHDALVAALDAGLEPQAMPWIAAPVLARLMAWEALDRLGSFEDLGRRCAETGDARNLLIQLPRIGRDRKDRLALLEQHRRWGEGLEAKAARAPVAAAARAGDGRIRLGLLSSDLRNHVVGGFAWPLFEHADPRFDLHVYSLFPGPADAMQAAMAERAAAYRHWPGLDPRRAAELIAGDGLDVLFELGGSTGSNRVEVMAHRLAPIQASWLGYPHSLGLSTIDYMLLDPYLAPPDPALLLERPLVMPRSFVTLGERFFRDEPAPAPEPPALRNGFVTFGSANAPYKYSPACMNLWAQVAAAVPGSRFLFVRPEADAPDFRRRAHAAFARRGVQPERIGFEAVRGNHLPFYAEIDICLDTIPLTGGTTTCESLWMGVPVVTLVGEAVFERLSYSILTNAGLGDLAAADPARYVETAVHLAADVERLRRLRMHLRDQIRSGPLGQPAAFARDFYDLVAATVAAGR